MGNPKAFLEIKRKEAGYRPVQQRKYDFAEVELTFNDEECHQQASRCMDCGVPFCHWNCPLGNRQPEWQDLVYKGNWREAYRILQETDDFPEFTGRVCPALCEKGCVLTLSIDEPVTIRNNEAAIIEKAFSEGYVVACPPRTRTGRKIAVIGSGPAGLACANQLNRKGHTVDVYEKDERIGGLLRLGIPDFKLNKGVIDRRLALMETEGVSFICNTQVGKDKSKLAKMLSDYDAICVAIGSGEPRNLHVEGRDLKGVYFALELLKQQNRLIAGDKVNPEELISAKGKKVLIIGGGDTGSDCVGTAIRQGAESVLQIEIMPQPPVGKNPDTPWPNFPQILKTTSSHKEGCERRWSLDTVRFIGENGILKQVEVAPVTWTKDKNGRMSAQRAAKTEIIDVDLVFLAMGFVHPVYENLVENLGVELDERKNVRVDAENKTSVAKVFAAGDASYGAGLVVRAIASGRKAAAAIDQYLSHKK
ncbi:MAG: glutamate synthase subunit beta [Porphyromonadaceae bacterium]|nr:glutamate synthase subunit beta [Porphyromonadaceae bacterium]